MSEQVEQIPPIDAGVVAKVVWQAQKALKEQLFGQSYQDWDKATDEERNDLVESVSNYLENKEKFKEDRPVNSRAFDLTCAIIDALLPQEKEEAEDGDKKEKKSPAKKAADKKD